MHAENTISQTLNQARAHSLDAVRGLAILLMVLSGVVPYRVLPAWMYHAQLPPPTHAFDSTLPGLTWVDLVFPMFLFAMGAAIPLALSRRLQQGLSPLKLHAGILERGFLLAFFAIFLQHVRPYTLNASPDTLTWLTALAGFLVLFAIYVNLPRDWGTAWKWGIRAGGWIGAMVLLYFVTFPDGSGFRLTRSDLSRLRRSGRRPARRSKWPASMSDCFRPESVIANCKSQTPAKINRCAIWLRPNRSIL
jgi:predicted acyltransferase